MTAPRAHQADLGSEFVCQSSGSRPEAKIIWLKNNQIVVANSTTTKIEQDQFVQQFSHGLTSLGPTTTTTTSSKLTIRLKASDHGSQLVCRATNEPLAQLIQSKRNQQQQQQQTMLPTATAADVTQVSFDELNLMGENLQEASLEDTRTLTVNCK